METVKKQLNILYQCDNNYAFMVGISITSLLCNAGKDLFYNIFILTPDMSENNREKIYSLEQAFPNIDFKIQFLDAKYCENEVISWGVPDHRGSYVTYYKLLINHYLKDTDVDKIIHIGADTLVTGDLSELPDFDFQGAPFAMNCSGKNFFERHIPINYDYCIAEMIYFNFPEWRKQKCEERIIKHVREIGEIYGGKDQGILNMEFHGEYAQLPLKYNIYGLTYNFTYKNKRRFVKTDKVSDEELKSAYEKPEIIHIPATFLYRPNIKGSIDPTNEIWWEYAELSPWNDIEPQNSGDVGFVERFMRWTFIYMPKAFHEWLYIMLRRLNGIINSIKYPPLPEDKRKAGFNANSGT